MGTVLCLFRDKSTLELLDENILDKSRLDMTSFINRDDVLTLILHLGYLAYDINSQEAFIPNQELAGEFENAVECGDWKNVADALQKSEELLKATMTGNSDIVENIPVISLLGLITEKKTKSTKAAPSSPGTACFFHPIGCGISRSHISVSYASYTTWPSMMVVTTFVSSISCGFASNRFLSSTMISANIPSARVPRSCSQPSA